MVVLVVFQDEYCFEYFDSDFYYVIAPEQKYYFFGDYDFVILPQFFDYLFDFGDLMLIIAFVYGIVFWDLLFDNFFDLIEDYLGCIEEYFLFVFELAFDFDLAVFEVGPEV